MTRAVATPQVVPPQAAALITSPATYGEPEAAFEEPFDFWVDRPSNRPLAFGHGPHVYRGQHLAKLEMRLPFEELLPRLDRLELDGEPAWTQSGFVSGPKRLPIRFRAA